MNIIDFKWSSSNPLFGRPAPCGNEFATSAKEFAEVPPVSWVRIPPAGCDRLPRTASGDPAAWCVHLLYEAELIGRAAESPKAKDDHNSCGQVLDRHSAENRLLFRGLP